MVVQQENPQVLQSENSGSGALAGLGNALFMALAGGGQGPGNQQSNNQSNTAAMRQQFEDILNQVLGSANSFQSPAANVNSASSVSLQNSQTTSSFFTSSQLKQYQVLIATTAHPIADASAAAGYGGHNTLIAQSGNDTLIGNTSDTLLGGPGNSLIDVSGGAGGNSYFGGTGNDIIRLGDNDTAYLGSGVDTVEMGSGDIVYDGFGADRYIVADQNLPTSVNKIVNFNASNDKLQITRVPGISQFSDLTLQQTFLGTLVSYQGHSIVFLQGTFASQLNSNNCIIDSTAPQLTLSLNSDTGQSNTDKITTNPSVKGTVTDPNGIASLKAGFDNAAVGSYVDVTNKIGANGNFLLDQTTINQIFGAPLTAGQHTIKLIATDSYGNATPHQDLQFTYVIDNTPPQITVALTNDTGNNHTDRITTDDAISGSVSSPYQVTSLKAGFDNAVPGSFVNITNKLNANGTFNLDANSINTIFGGSLSAGQHTLKVQATDEFGVVSAINNFAFTYVIDNTPPQISVALSNDNGHSHTDKITTDDSVSGTVSSQFQIATVKAGFDNAPLASYVDITAKLNANGTFALTPADLNTVFGGSVTAGTHTLNIKATDEYGVASSLSSLTFTYVIDNTPPQISVALSNDNGHSQIDKITTDDSVSGTVSSQFQIATVKAGFDNTPLASYVDITTKLNANGTFALTPADLNTVFGGSVTAGTHTLNIKATDEYGVASSLSSLTFTYVIDNTPPQISVALSNDNGHSQTDKITTDDSVSGTVSSQFQIATVKAGFDNTPLASYVDITTKLNANGTFALTPADLNTVFGGSLTAGQHTLNVLATDEYGVQSVAATLNFLLVIDGTAPAITIGLVNDADDDHFVTDPALQGTVTDANLVVSFKAGLDGAQAQNFVDITAKLDANGNYNLSKADLDQIAGGSLTAGQHTIRLQAADEFGAVSNEVNLTFTYITDSIAPSITAAFVQDTGISRVDKISHAVTITGTALDNQPGISLKAGLDGMSAGDFVDITASLDPNGNYSLDQSALEQITGGPLARGQHVLHLQSTDVANNLTTLDFSFNYNKPFEVFPGDQIEINLRSYFPNSATSTFAIQTEGFLPTTRLLSDGTLQFAPLTTEYGTYDFVVVQRDNGNITSKQEFCVQVSHDPDTTTRLSGTVVELDGHPVEGLTVSLGQYSAVSDEDGKYTIRIDGPLTADKVIFHGEDLEEDEEGGEEELYAFLEERLTVLLGHELYSGVNNVIARVEYIPVLDLENAHIVDPNLNQIFTTEAIPGVSLEIHNHTLIDEHGQYFTGLLSITEMPVDKMPIARPPGLFPDLVVAIQPGEMTLSQPALLTLPNRAGYSVGTQMQLWSISAATGTFQVVGTGIVQSDGLIHTVSGGVTYTDWHFFAPLAPLLDPALNPFNMNQDCHCGAATQPGQSSVDTFTGAVNESHTLASYNSLGENRALTLNYDSIWAAPQQVLHFGYQGAVPGSLDRLVATLTLQLGNQTFSLPGLVDDTGINTGMHYWQVDTSNAIAALQIDMRDLPSGVYTYTLRDGMVVSEDSKPLAGGGSGTVVTGIINGTLNTYTGQITNINTSDSPFGSGWSLVGLQHIVESPDGSAMVIDGDGHYHLFGAPDSPGGAYQQADGDFSTLVRQVDETFVRTMTDRTIYKFDSQNRLDQLIDSNGNITAYQYDVDGHLLSMTDPVGLQTNFTYTGNRITQIADPFGRITQLAYDADGNLTSITDPDGAINQYQYDSNHLMTGGIDQTGATNQKFYDASGRITHEIQPDGTTLTFDPIESQGLVPLSQTLDPIHSAIAPDLTVHSQQVGSVLYITRSVYVDANGHEHIQFVNRDGQLVYGSDEVGAEIAINYNAANLPFATQDGKGNAQEFHYDTLGNLTSMLDRNSLDLTPRPMDFYGISDSGDHVAGLNNATTAQSSLVDLPFSFQFYGQTYSQIGVNNNGLLSFGGTNSTFTNVGLGSSQAATALNNLPSILPFWDAFETAQGGGVFTSRVWTDTTGAVGERKFIVQWEQVANAGTATESVVYNYQVVLDEGTSNIHFNYKSVGQNDGSGHAFGGMATVGIWNSPGQFRQFNRILFDGTSLDVSPSQISDSVGTTTGAKVFTYDGTFNRVTSITDELGHRTLFDIDPANGNVRSMTQVNSAGNVVTTYSYNTHGQLTQMVNPLGVITAYAYDALGRVISVTEAQGTLDEAVTTYEHDLFGNVTAIIDPNNNRTEYVYDAMNRVTQIKEANPGGIGGTNPVTNFEYDEMGNLTKTTDALGHITIRHYDNMHRLIEQIDPLGHLSSYDYDDNGNLTSVTDELGRTTRRTFDERNRLVSIIDDANNTTLFAYDLADNIVSVKRPSGSESTFQYGPRNELTSSFDESGMRIRYGYDAAGHLVSATNQNNGDRDYYQYDSLDRLIYKQDGLGNFWNYQYDKEGNLIAIRDRMGNITYNSFDSLDRLTDVMDPSGGHALYGYDSDSNLISVTDSVGNQTQYVYDALNRKVSEIDPLNHSSLFSYDNNNNLISGTDRDGHQRTFSYDALDRLIAEHWIGGGNDLTYSYDAVGNMTSVSDAFSTIAMQYNNLNQLRQSDNAGTPDAPHVVLNYTYDVNGNLLTEADIVNGIAGATDAFAYNTRNQLSGITESGQAVQSKHADYSYDSNGRLILLNRGTSLTDYSYDKMGQLTSIRNSGATPVDNHSYTRDADGRIVRIANTTGSTLTDTIKYSYDELARLTSATHTNNGFANESYMYDDNGNRLASESNSNFVYGPGNQLLSDGTYNYVYDDNGSLSVRTDIATGATRTFTYDFRNRLTEVIDADNLGVQTQVSGYTYDAFDRRITKSVNGAVTHYAYDGNNVRMEFADSGLMVGTNALLQARYFNGLGVDNVLAVEKYTPVQAQAGLPGTAYWLLKDQVGSTTDLVAVSNGALQNHIVYDSFGNVQSQTNAAIGTSHLFAGREFDAETGNYYNRARQYNAALGRFMSQDPISFAGGMNLYAYVGNNPLSWRDPFGLKGIVPNKTKAETNVIIDQIAHSDSSMTQKVVDIAMALAHEKGRFHQGAQECNQLVDEALRRSGALDVKGFPTAHALKGLLGSSAHWKPVYTLAPGDELNGASGFHQSYTAQDADVSIWDGTNGRNHTSINLANGDTLYAGSGAPNGVATASIDVFAQASNYGPPSVVYRYQP